MVELRKRPVREEPPPKAAAPKKAKKSEDGALAPNGKTENPSAGAISPNVGDTIALESFGGEIETNDGNKTTLAKLVEESKAGVVLFTYPKASTPGCKHPVCSQSSELTLTDESPGTTQVCLFRDSYEPLTATGLSIFGLSNDSPTANTNFKTKQNLPYPLLCDPQQTLISAIGFKKPPKGTTRGVFVVDKSGKVLAAEAGGPAATVDVVKALVAKMGGESEAKGIQKAEERAKEAGKEEGGAAADHLAAETAAEVADVAKMLDKSKTSTPVPS